MTTLIAPDPDDRDPTTGSADVVDLDTARERRIPDAPNEDAPTEDATTPDTIQDTTADAVPDEEGERPVPVDPPGQARMSRLEAVRASERRPIVPAWARSRNEFRDATRWFAGHYAHAAAFHVSRTPVYASRLAVRAPRGAVRVVSRASRWVGDAEGVPVRLAAVRREDAELYLKLSRQRDTRVRARTLLAVLVLPGVVVAVGLLVALAPPLVEYAAAVALVILCGVLGSPADKPLLGRAVVAPKVAKLTSDIVIRALGSLGIAEINKAAGKGRGGITFPAPITRDGPGWRTDVDLPFGVTVTDIMERRDRLASGLRRPLGCVWPEPAHDQHAGRLVLWVGDQDMSQAKAPAWPLARHGQADVFKPVPFGTDQRMRPVLVPLMYTNVLIGAMPGAGKTFALRVLLLAAALDPLAELRTFELKGSGDLSTLEKVAHHYASGPDDATLEQVMASLREVYQDLERRAKTIAGLPREQCPENKVIPALAARKSLRLHPLVVAIDECQELFAHAEFGKEAAELCIAIIKRGRALGVILILATQRPDKDSLPTGVSANVGVRFCLRVMGQVENDMILGTSMYRNGIRATTFTNRDKGIGYLVGATDEPQIARSAYLDNPAAERIVARARGLREAAGTLTGHAIGEAVDHGPSFDLLADILAVVPAGETKVWSETVVERLAELRPAVYGGWGAEQLTAALKPHGITTGQVWGKTSDGKGANRRGIDRDHITTTVAERNHTREAS